MVPQDHLLHRADIFSRCVETSSDTVMITNSQGKLVYVNPAWVSTYGYTPEEALGRTPALIRSGHQNSAFYQAMWSQIANTEIGSWKGELINRAKGGHEVPVFLTISPIKADDGELIGYMGLATDITEKKRLEAQMLHQDRLANLGIIAAGLAHEIGNPLGVIRGRAEYLQSLFRENETAVNGLETVIGQIDRISRLVHSLLNLARGSESHGIRPVALLASVEEVCSLLSQKTTKDGIVVTRQIPHDACVLADSARLEQILLNLVLNSIQAIEEARFRGRTGPHTISLTAAAKQKGWEIAIRDSGIGIPKENLDCIFKPFFTTKPSGIGTGMGLAICDQIVRSWGGTVNVESEPEKGATFTLWIPAGKR